MGSEMRRSGDFLAFSEKKLHKIRLLPNVITAFGLSCGLFVIFKMAMTEVGEANFWLLSGSAGLLLLAAIADLLDGAVARAIKAESYFGGIFDSLADATSFGVAPAVFMLKALSVPPGSALSFWATLSAMVFSLCGILRLVRFNVLTLSQAETEETALLEKKHFTGLPIPAAAAAAVSLTLFLFSPDLASLVSLSITGKTTTLVCSFLLLGYCMVSRWKFPSLKSLEIKVSSFQTVFLTTLSAVLLFFGMVHHYATVSLFLSWGYVCVAWTLAIIRLIAGKKSKTLEEFEPDPDELEEE